MATSDAGSTYQPPIYIPPRLRITAKYTQVVGAADRVDIEVNDPDLTIDGRFVGEMVAALLTAAINSGGGLDMETSLRTEQEVRESRGTFTIGTYTSPVPTRTISPEGDRRE